MATTERVISLKSIWDIVHRKVPGAWTITIKTLFSATLYREDLSHSCVKYMCAKNWEAQDPAATWSNDGELWVK